MHTDLYFTNFAYISKNISAVFIKLRVLVANTPWSRSYVSAEESFFMRWRMAAFHSRLWSTQKVSLVRSAYASEDTFHKVKWEWACSLLPCELNNAGDQHNTFYIFILRMQRAYYKLASSYARPQTKRNRSANVVSTFLVRPQVPLRNTITRKLVLMQVHVLCSRA